MSSDLTGECAGRLASICARAIPYVDKGTNWAAGKVVQGAKYVPKAAKFVAPKAKTLIKSASPLHGKEFNIGNKLRIKPTGFWKGKTWAQRLPHYHYRKVSSPDKTKRTGIKWHRPWETIFKRWRR